MAVDYDRASIESLPNELRSKIYHHVFSESLVRLHAREISESTSSRPQQSTTTYLALQLVCKAFRNDASLHRSFLQCSTIAISEGDLDRLRILVGAEGCELIRHVQIRLKTWRWHPAATKPTDQRDAFTLSSILKVTPNLRSVSTALDGPHINTFERDFDFTSALLFAVYDRIVHYSRKKDPALFIDDLARSLANNRLSNTVPRNVYPNSPILSLSSTGTYDSVPLKKALLCFRNFAHTLARCVERTGPKYTQRWYYNFLYEAQEHDIEVLFKLNLTFLTDMPPKSPVPTPERCQEIEGISVSSKDWTIRLETNGRRYQFIQTQPEGSWRGWIESQLDLYGGPINQTLVEVLEPTPKRQKPT